MPRTYRPLGARVATAMASVVVIAAVSFLWIMLPDDVQDDFSVFQRLTLLGFFGAVLVLLHGIFRTAARADEVGLTVTNGYHRHRFEWAEIVRLSLTPNRPWALIDLADGTTLSVMAIQTADGDRGMRLARELAGVIAERNRTDRDA